MRKRENKSPTMKDVARLAGVSISTVSHVINKTRYVEPETREKVYQAIKTLGYRPNILASSLRKRVTNTIGLIISNITNLFYPEVVRGVEDLLAKYNYNLILCNSDEDVEKEKNYIEVLFSRRVDGLIITPSKSSETRENLDLFREKNIPVVLVDRKIEGLEEDVVLADNIEGTYEAISYLISLGHKRIGIITGPLDTTTGCERLEGYLKALEDKGIKKDDNLIYEGDFKKEGGYKGVEALLNINNPPTAIFTSNNLMALGALKKITELGLKIPQDLSLISFDDMDWFPYFSPPLTAVYQPAYELGETAVKLLFERLKRGRKKRKEVRLPTKLIIRESCAPPK
ncbi:LacI family DNA-binding transcriptional regulator [Dictyoglomus thermophilum]|uniref:Transcriptional regulator n=1 Tax=Dictyoglomus thermophilum (strain ATCC 35947 / DSM 3960 / H-6-12) TaxID=309799 RepID=B5YAE4_DICT6|nr:LacI family DNA-binding transcriptional regulator [Dictyoglomus thermophilum]ACI18412.1 transcriptional regulator [Dictyoglomus thermophilum H-6-12]